VAARVVVDLVLGWQYVLATVDGFMDFIMRRVVVAVLVWQLELDSNIRSFMFFSGTVTLFPSYFSWTLCWFVVVICCCIKKRCTWVALWILELWFAA